MKRFAYRFALPSCTLAVCLSLRADARFLPDTGAAASMLAKGG
ncbi:MAG TPA: hypothetical protein VGO51_10760 [Burkholderiaceae bacterium]|jgi:hypothetical protein|nr:hypothetical protein [Burkholderiaceae bacterium]